MKNLFKFSWAKFFIMLGLVLLTVLLFLLDLLMPILGCYYSLECKILKGVSFILAFPFIGVDYEENTLIAILIQQIYLYFWSCLIYGLYLVIKKRTSIKHFISFLAISIVIWGGLFFIWN